MTKPTMCFFLRQTIQLFPLLVGLAASPLRAAENAPASHGAEAFFKSAVYPLLEKNCFLCHSDDPEGDLHLDSRAGLLKGGKSGPAAVPGDPSHSLIIKAVHRTSDKLAMPPKKILPPEDVAILTRWIQDGAAWADDLPPPVVARATKQAPRPETHGFDGAGPLPLRRLTRDEYLNTVRDLFGEAPKLSRAVPQDAPGASGFITASVVSYVEANRFLSAAEEIGQAAVKHLEIILPCDPKTSGEDACAHAFIAHFGRRVFRRPISPTESARLFGYYKAVRQRFGHDFAGGIRMTLQVMLQSPNFLYHWELGPDTPPGNGAKLVRLTPYEIASRLSYFLIGSMPDDTLFAAADAGALTSPEQIASQARRLIRTPRAQDTILAFYFQWLRLDKVRDLNKDRKIFPDFDFKMASALEAESTAFLRHLFSEGDGRFETLMLADYSFLNETLAKFYGVDGVVGKELRQVPLDPEQRIGILTQGSFLASEALPNSTSPIKRGKLVLEHVLCLDPPPPPEGLDVKPPPPNPKAQMRELYNEHSQNKACAGCHRQMDPMGFAFENYDGVGKFRTYENGRPVNSSGMLTGLHGGDKPFKNGREFIAIIAHSEEAHRCMVKKWFRYTVGRHETPEEGSSLDQVYERFAQAKFDMRELIVAVTTTRAFLYRTAEGP